MSPRLRDLTAKEVVKCLESKGFEIFSQKGSHIRLRGFVNGIKKVYTVPSHGNKSLDKGLLLAIYKDIKRDFINDDDVDAFFYTE